MKLSGIATMTLVLTVGIAPPLFAAEAANAFNEGVKHQRAGKYKEAIAAYDRAIKGDPQSAETFLARGSALAKTGAYERALKDRQ